MQKRLFKLRMKINQGRKANRKEVEMEFKRNKGVCLFTYLLNLFDK